jgi:MFS family permease
MLHLAMSRFLNLFNPDLPRTVWVLQLGVLVNFLGNGLVGPFLVIYLHFGRGIPIALAASAVAFGGITAVTSGLLAGALADRVGPRNVLVAGMLCNAAAYGLYTQVTVPWQAYAVGLLVGVGTGAFGPSVQSLIASMVPPDNRQAAFAQNRVTSVVGLGVGGVIGGLIAARGLQGYLLLLALDSITFLVMAAVPLLLPSGRSPARARAGGGYALVIRDRGFLQLTGLNILMVSAGLAPMFVLLPAYAKVQAHVGVTAIGFIYAASTFTVVAAQLPVARFTRGRNRMQMLRAAATTWIASWTVILAAGAWLSGGSAAIVIGLAAIAYAIGECLYSSIMLPTASALAPDTLRGRYLGVMGLSWQSGFLLGPSLGGAVLGAYPLALPAFCAAGCVAAALGSGAVDRSLDQELRLTPLPVRAA